MSKEMVYWTFGVLVGVAGSYVPSTWNWTARLVTTFALGAGSVWISHQLCKIFRRE
jgi:hypothetical protein